MLPTDIAGIDVGALRRPQASKFVVAAVFGRAALGQARSLADHAQGPLTVPKLPYSELPDCARSRPSSKANKALERMVHPCSAEGTFDQPLRGSSGVIRCAPVAATFARLCLLCSSRSLQHFQTVTT